MAASSLALKHLVSRSLLSRPLRAVTPPAVPIRVFSTTTARGPYDGRFSDPRVESPFYGEKTHMNPGVDSNRKNVKSRETFDGLFMRVDMPGVGKENIKVRFENDMLMMEGEGQKDFDDDELGPRYVFNLQLVGVQRFNTDEITAKIANGVLKVCVPKFKVKVVTTNVVRLTMSLRSFCAVTPPAVPICFFSSTAAHVCDTADGDSDDGRRNDPFASFPSHGNNFDPSVITRTNMSEGVDSAYSFRKFWKGKENFDGLYLRFDMPGVGKENIKVWIEKDTVVMEGEGQKDFEDDETGSRYDYRVQLVQAAQYNTDAVKVNLVNGVLKVFVPKFKAGESANVVNVSVV